jgi:hypothetical protein
MRTLTDARTDHPSFDVLERRDVPSAVTAGAGLLPSLDSLPTRSLVNMLVGRMPPRDERPGPPPPRQGPASSCRRGPARAAPGSEDDRSGPSRTSRPRGAGGSGRTGRLGGSGRAGRAGGPDRPERPPRVVGTRLRNGENLGAERALGHCLTRAAASEGRARSRRPPRDRPRPAEGPEPPGAAPPVNSCPSSTTKSGLLHFCGGADGRNPHCRAEVRRGSPGGLTPDP